jgi:transcription elongation factor Elf1
MATLEELEERLSAAEAKLLAQNKRRVLRDSLTCPSCDNTEIVHISELQAYGLPVRVDHEGGFVAKAVGVLELYVCSQCGYGEVQLEASKLKDKERKNVQVISKAREAREEDPYR